MNGSTMPGCNDRNQLLSYWVQHRETGSDDGKLRRVMPSGAAESRYISE